MKIILIAGARPNFMKIAPILEAGARLGADTLSFTLVHTGQHYDEKMSDVFFRQLGIPEPDINLGCGGGTQAEQTAAIMVAFERVLQDRPADMVVVVGDVTSTLACSIVAKKMGSLVAHVEGGIRSGDLSMPEEINRMVTDSISDHFFTTSEVANANLRKLGVGDERIHFVGNTMIDTLLRHRDRFVAPAFWEDFGLRKGEYLVLTLHRPANVDDGVKLKETLEAILNNCEGYPVVFPVHPRTARVLEGLSLGAGNLMVTDPLPYLEFNYLVGHSKGVITDSGGITEETTVMGIPCLTLRDNTERPETVTLGTNELIGTHPASIPPALERLFSGQWKKGAIPPLWDGKAGERIVGILRVMGEG